MSLFCYFFFSVHTAENHEVLFFLYSLIAIFGTGWCETIKEFRGSWRIQFNTNDIPNQAKIKLNNLKILLNVIFMLTAAFVIFLQFSIIKVTKFVWEFLRFLRFNFMIEKRVDSILLGVARIKRASSKRVTFIIPFELNR